MKKLVLVLLASLACVPCFADNSKIELRGSADDGTTTISTSGLITKYFTSGVVQQQTISLDSNSFTAISVPIGAKAILIDVISADGLVLRSISGGAGISLDKTTPVLLPLSADSTTITLGISNTENNSNKVKVLFY